MQEQLSHQQTEDFGPLIVWGLGAVVGSARLVIQSGQSLLSSCPRLEQKDPRCKILGFSFFRNNIKKNMIESSKKKRKTQAVVNHSRVPGMEFGWSVPLV